MVGAFLTTSTSGVMTEVSSVVSSGLTWLTDTADTVASNPLLLLMVTLPLIGTGIGLLKRVLS